MSGVYYIHQSIDGTQQVIDECWKVIRNPKETGDRKMMALQLAFEGTKSKIDMLKMVKNCMRICIVSLIMILIMANRQQSCYQYSFFLNILT